MNNLIGIYYLANNGNFIESGCQDTVGCLYERWSQEDESNYSCNFLKTEKASEALFWSHFVVGLSLIIQSWVSLGVYLFNIFLPCLFLAVLAAQDNIHKNQTI